MSARPHRVNLVTGSMFSGIGLLDFGLHLAGLEHAWFAERDAYRRSILARRWPRAQILDDVRAVRAGVVPRVDVLAGGFPCKGVSGAGLQNGFDHPETVLWREQARAVRELRPRYVVVENVAAILSLHDGAVWGEVVGDLAALGYELRWDCLPAAAFGAPHRRDRVFLLAADPDWAGRRAGAWESAWRESAGSAVSAGGASDAADSASSRLEGAGVSGRPPIDGGPTAADADRQRRQQVASGASGDEAADGRRSDPDHEPVGARPGRLPAAGRGVAVDWGAYGPAIERWETIHGAAPEPLVRRVDDGRASRVERSRLSALGDGVQVQAGWLVGRWIVAHAAGELDAMEAAA